jgi:hypothetical protein
MNFFKKQKKLIFNSHTSLLIITTIWKHKQYSSFLKTQFDKLIPKLKQLTIVNELNNLQQKMIKWKKITCLLYMIP